MSGHTPGPWHACHKGECPCKGVWCDEYPVAKVTCGQWGDDYPALRFVGDSSLDRKVEAYTDQITYGSVNEDVATANARLIAAAPSMFDFACRIEARFAAKERVGVALNNDEQCAFAEAREVIAKAAGESP